MAGGHPIWLSGLGFFEWETALKSAVFDYPSGNQGVLLDKGNHTWPGKVRLYLKDLA
jgi:hypothetical protein